MSRIAGQFQKSRDAGRAAFIPFLTAGDPDLETTLPLCEALERAGADLIELGVPFSDPMADGPVIQRASQRALAAGSGLRAALEIAASVRRSLSIPIVLFTYFNPIVRMGEAVFTAAAARAGVDGVLVTDLPYDEGESLRDRLMGEGIDPILLVAPSSPADRISRAAALGRGFLYCISRPGVTGTNAELPEGLEDLVARVRRGSPLPVAVGFGISSPGQFAAVGRIADGVVVGSALVAAVEAARQRGESAGEIARSLERAARALTGI